MPVIHQRERIVTEAKLKVSKAFDEATKDLTDGERLQIAAQVFSSYVGDTAKYMIRMERHGDPSKPGGFAG